MLVKMKLIKVNFAILLLLIVFSACKEESALDRALRLAEGNRDELQKVLDYYSNNEADSLKLRAAVFLIENMPGYYYYEDEKLEMLKSRLYPLVKEKNIYTKEAISIIEKEIGVVDVYSLSAKYDINTIKAEYLISNIEHSFRVWQESPWRKNITFKQFCREILPYRIGNEPIEDWRMAYYERYKPLLDSLSVDSDPVAACQIIYDSISKENWIFSTQLQLPHLGALTLLTNRLGGCVERCDLALYIMRSLGIPGGIDLILQNPDKMYTAHYWNYVTDTLGRHVDFTLYEKRPEPGVRDTLRKKGKVYRMNYDVQAGSLPCLYPGLEIPKTLNNKYISDVSSEYYEGYELNFDIAGRPQKENILYLSVFDNTKWVPVDWTRIHKGKAVFRNVEANIAYLPTFFDGYQTIQAGYPVVITKEGDICQLIPDTVNTCTASLYRKHPIPNWWPSYYKRAKDGQFQGANKENFTDATTLYTICEDGDMKYYTVDTNHKGKFRYVRYLSSEDGYCNMAEVKFFSDGSMLRGSVIGTDGSYQNNTSRTKQAVFDQDPLTFYDAIEASGSWAGLDLGEPKQIDRITYLFRNDDNNIREDDEYELYYFSRNELMSLGRQKGTTDGVLVYHRVPANALLLLHNHTRGQEERIFTYEDGAQRWW